MKKQILSLLVLATSVVACTGDYTDWSNPQKIDQPETVTFGDGTVTEVGVIDLSKAVDSVQICSFAAPSATSSAYAPVYKVNLGDSIYAVSTTGKMLATKLQQYIVKNYGKSPVERDMNATMSQWMSDGKSYIKMATSDVFKIKAVPEAPEMSAAYYLVGDMCGWDKTKMLTFGHDDSNIYDNPTFTLTFDVTAENQKWQIIPQKNIAIGDFNANPGVLGPEKGKEGELKGSLVSKDATQGVIATPGTYKMTINVIDKTYEITKMIPIYYMVGALQGWNPNADGKTIMFYPETDKVQSFTGKFTGDGNFKVWMKNDFGNWGNAYGTPVDGDQSMSGEFKQGASGAIKCPTPGDYYTVKIDFSNNTYTWTKLANQEPTTYQKISLIGDFNEWGDNDIAMKEVNPHNWYVEFTQKATGDVKFRANGSWAISWGNASSVLDLSKKSYGKGTTDNGQNLKCPTGKYDVFFNDITGEFVFAEK